MFPMIADNSNCGLFALVAMTAIALNTYNAQDDSEAIPITVPVYKEMPCVPPPLSPDRFQCYHRSQKTPATYKCPKFKCQNETGGFADGYCCIMYLEEIEWKFCWEDGEAVLSHSSSPIKDIMDDCVQHTECEIVEYLPTEWKGEGCCEDTSYVFPRVCCTEKEGDHHPVINCYPKPTKPADVVQCEDVACKDDDSCFIKGSTDNVCCEHKALIGKVTCCIKNLSEESDILPTLRVIKDVPLIPWLPGINFNCEPLIFKKPDYYQCPEFDCIGGFEEHELKDKESCCVVSAFGVTWVCCKNIGCDKNYKEVDLPYCSYSRCTLNKAVAKQIREFGCCQDETEKGSFTCCLRKEGEGSEQLLCVPQHAKEPAYIKCMDMPPTEELCKIVPIKRPSCCVQVIKGTKMTCCVNEEEISLTTLGISKILLSLMMSYIILISIIGLFNLWISCLRSEETEHIQKMGNRLVNISFPLDYDNTVSPSFFTDNRPISLKLLFLPVAIPHISETDMYMELEFYLSLNWTDPRVFVTELPSSFEFILHQNTPLNVNDKIWKPPLYFYNCRRCKAMIHITSMRKESHILFYHFQTSEFELYYREMIQFRCNMNFQTYPLDEHKCSIYMAINIRDSRDEGKLELHYHKLDLEFFEEHLAKQIPPQFEFLSVEVERKCLNTAAHKEKECVKYVIHFRRYLSFHMMCLYLPSTLIVITSLLSFIMDIQEINSRILLGIFSLLTLSILYAAILPKIPPVTYVKSIDVWMITCSTFVSLTLVEYYVATQITRRWKYLDKILDNVVRIMKKRKISSGRASIASSTKEVHFISMKTNQIDLVSKILFPIFFAIFNIIYWTYSLVTRSSYAEEEET